jgi:hypothetical protein
VAPRINAHVRATRSDERETLNHEKPRKGRDMKGQDMKGQVMSSIVLYRDFHRRSAKLPQSGSASACADRGILRRLFSAIERSFRRQAEEEAGRFIAEHGGRLTDDIERQLGDHFNGSGFTPYAPVRSFRPFAREG